MTKPSRKTVGVRELRQNASSILEELLQSGESVMITNHGKPQAILQPITPDLVWREQLIAEGRLIPAITSGSLADIKPVALERGSPSMSDILEDSRAERL